MDSKNGKDLKGTTRADSGPEPGDRGDTSEEAVVTQNWLSVLTRPCICRKKRPPPKAQAKPYEPSGSPGGSGVPPPCGGPPPLEHDEPIDIYVASRLRGQPCCETEDLNISRSPHEFCRKSGFNAPLNLYQVLAWVLFSLDVAIFCTIILTSFSLIPLIVVAVPFALVTISVAYLTVVITASDPADPLVFQDPKKRQVLFQPGGGYSSCELCGVIKNKSKHCRACNKCVADFDHHCRWLNTCIGGRNYSSFFGLVCSVGLFSLIIIIGSAAVVLEQLINESVTARWITRYGAYLPALFYTFIVVLLLVNLAIVVLDGQLVVMHMYLWRKKMTTYHYLQQRIQRENEGLDNPDVCCIDYIIVDYKRLRRAREKFQRKRQEGESAVPLSGAGQPPAAATEEPSLPPRNPRFILADTSPSFSTNGNCGGRDGTTSSESVAAANRDSHTIDVKSKKEDQLYSAAAAAPTTAAFEVC